MNNHARILAVVLAVSASGCSLVVDPKKSDPLATAEGFCNSFQDVYDRLIVKCGDLDQAAADALMTQMRFGCRNLGDSAAAGRVGYDRGVAEQCLSRLESVNCNSGGEDIIGLCVSATPGKVAVGGACYFASGFQSECVTGARCDDTATCPGVCAAPGVAFGSCATSSVFGSNNRCVDGYYCATAAMPPYAAMTCLPVPTTPGAACDTTDHKCGSGLVCGYNAGYFCVQPAAHGADCSATDYECALAADYCRRSATGLYSCVTAPTSPQPAGGDCYNNGSSDCQAGLICDYNADYTCVPALPLGSSCTTSGANVCGRGNHCSVGPLATSGTCATDRRVGEACTVGFDDCSNSGGWCSGPGLGEPGVCTGASANGGPCGELLATPNPPSGTVYREYARCDMNLYCLRVTSPGPGTCRPYGGVGASCASPNYDACGEPFTGLTCSGYAGTPPYVCVANACTMMFGFLSF